MIAPGNHVPTPDLRACLDQPILDATGGSVRHLVVSVRAPESQRRPDERRLPLNIALVIDASGSMAGAPLAAAKAAVLDVVESLTAADHVSVVSFASDTQLHAETVRLDAVGKLAVRRAVAGIDTRGSTALCDGWLAGCEAVARRQATTSGAERHRVVLLSDGHANQGETDPAALARHADALRQRGVVSSTVGVGCNYSPTQLQAIAEAGGGRMHDAELPEEIARIVTAELNDTLATTVENLEIDLQLPPGVTAEPYGAAPARPGERGPAILLGALLGGATRVVVVRLTFGPGAPGVTATLGVAARWTQPGDDAERACAAPVVEVRHDAPGACAAAPRDLEAAKLVVEQWQAHVYRRALILNQDGACDEAAAFSAREAAEIQRYCAGVPDLERLLDGLDRFVDSVTTRYSPRSSKEMMLRSYKLSRHESDHRARHASPSFSDVIAEEQRQRRRS